MRAMVGDDDDGGEDDGGEDDGGEDDGHDDDGDDDDGGSYDEDSGYGAYNIVVVVVCAGFQVDKDDGSGDDND